MLEYKFRESGGGLEGKARGSHPVRQRKTPMPLKKLKLIILTPFDATYSPPPLDILGDFLPVFKLLCTYKGMQTLCPIQSPGICHGNYGSPEQCVCKYTIFRKMRCKLFIHSQVSSTSFPARVSDKYSIIYLSLKLNMYPGKCLRSLVI